jgi:hypothetical protein
MCRRNVCNALIQQSENSLTQVRPCQNMGLDAARHMFSLLISPSDMQTFVQNLKIYVFLF